MPNTGQETGHPEDVWQAPASPSFRRELRRALRHLHDPVELCKSPLIELFGLERHNHPASALRRTLTDAIEWLRPNDDVPPQARAWRIYQLLYYRYTEQSTQREVAGDLGLSIRHLRREETLAIQALADRLWSRENLELRWRERGAGRPAGEEEPAADAQTPSQRQELQWLQASIPSQPVDVEEVARVVLGLAGPLAREASVHLECRMPAGLPRLVVQLTTIRQALLSVCATAIRCVPGGQVVVGAESHRWDVRITVRARQAGTVQPLGDDDMERLGMARQLIEMSAGSLELEPRAGGDWPFVARLNLPASGQVPALIIDDNVDTLQLLQRYLSNTRYRFVGTSDSKQALALAKEARPRIIVLDVMLPEVDGWELLGRLHEHPRTHDVPIVVCTILPHEQLALSLGAAGFLRKPVSRLGFLSALDRWLDPLARESG